MYELQYQISPKFVGHTYSKSWNMHKTNTLPACVTTSLWLRSTLYTVVEYEFVFGSYF
jgi:hypothetical protein